MLEIEFINIGLLCVNFCLYKVSRHIKYCNMTLLRLAAWFPPRLVTSCLQNARAPKRDETGGKKGQCSLVGMGVVCVCVY